MIVLLLNRNAAMRMKQSKIPIYQFILDEWYRTFCLIKVTKFNTVIIFSFFKIGTDASQKKQ